MCGGEKKHLVTGLLSSQSKYTTPSTNHNFLNHTKKQHTTLITYRRPTMEAAAVAVAAIPQVQLKHHKNIPTTTNNYASLSSYPSFLNIHHNTNRHNKNRNTKRCICLSVSSKPTSNSTETRKPQIELEFLSESLFSFLFWLTLMASDGDYNLHVCEQPKPEPDGTYQRQTVTAESGKKLIRNIMNENKIELYGTYGKVMNCGGGGSCGTCIVEIVDGGELLNQRTNTENKYLKKKPESWRLACQTIVGNKENAGKVIVQRLPQWKK